MNLLMTIKMQQLEIPIAIRPTFFDGLSVMIRVAMKHEFLE
jgi:hypothetical protein